MRGAIRVGTSGWSYDDWEGPVYPRGLPPAEGLARYARLFPTVEVNSTFYRDPKPATVHGWATRAPRTEFTLKAPQDLTQDLLASGTPDAASARARAWKDLACAPLAEAGRLGAVLLQLAPHVLPNGATLDRLDAALAALAGPDVAVEPRNAAWLGGDGVLHPGAVGVLARHRAAVVLVDGPPFPAVEADTRADHAYARLHGRNADVWAPRKEGRGRGRPPSEPLRLPLRARRAGAVRGARAPPRAREAARPRVLQQPP